MLREDILEFKRLPAPENPAGTRCRALESITSFHLLVDASGKGFGLGLWGHKGLRYDSANWSTQWKNKTSNWKDGTNLTVRVKEIAKEHKLENVYLFILIDKQVFKVFF